MNFELNEILTIIDKVKATGLDSFEYQDTETKIKIRGAKPIVVGQTSGQVIGQTAQVMTAEPELEESNKSSYIEAPMVGTFYAAPAEEAPPFVSVGDQVKKGQTVAIIEAMKFMNEITSDIDGVVEEILVENESLVEFGQPLIRIRKSA